MHTKGPVEVVNRFYIFRYGDNVADCKQSRSLPYAEMQANAARLAAGWNLLETLERMKAVEILEIVALLLSEAGLTVDYARIAGVATAIRTALESKP
jgi:hypothetical protein